MQVGCEYRFSTIVGVKFMAYFLYMIGTCHFIYR